ncbi:hypothetical protein LMH87_002364 [Akanthomyces muscarius]|uniref:Heterokaryon incompatibility domain-containing protein n=1 Tax=Akanthomyces muscarius TaxID=2231603 RepID=A0A9W8UJ62_AKAMU|nr:hypothetical protein LMH87_002364 [Akanthomyces muscarius]KAJ4147862.1 hypothetical protein LMH87_002364 [Akanthomyces muscarius]
MKVVSVQSRTVVDVPDVAPPPYAILSHTRDAVDQKRPSQTNVSVGLGPDDDAPPHYYSSNPASPPIYTKSRPCAFSISTNKKTQSTLSREQLEQACEHARRCGVEYIWIAELCIDRTSSADLDDAVNGSRRRLRNSTVCFAYLHDLPAEVTTPDSDSSAWSRCRYWKRAWTLQELLLAPRVQFYDAYWNYRGDKDSPELAPLLSGITRIPRSVLLDSTTLSDVALAVRISWSVGRVAAREEDTAYALVAITEATLPVRYGEGAERAFIRLQEELLRDTRDGSLLAWRSARDGEVRGLLARSPSEFGHFAPAAAKELQRPWVFNGKVRFSSKGIELESRVCKGPGCVLLSIGQKRQDLGTSHSIAICFREWNGVYVRVTPASRVSSSALRCWRSIDVMRDVDDSHSLSLRNLFSSMPCRIEIAKRGGYDETWRQARMPRVVQDAEEEGGVAQQQDEDPDTDMKMESDEVMLDLTPQKSHTPPSNHSDGSYVHVAMAGSWMPQDAHHTTFSPQQQQQHQQQHTQDHDTYSDICVDDDGISSADSDPGSMTSNSAGASASVSESDWDDDNSGRGHPYPTRPSGEVDEDDADALATETRSTTTLAADKDDDHPDSSSSLRNLVMQPAIREQVLQTSYERVRRWISTVCYIAPPEDRLPPRSRINSTAWFASPESLTLLNSTSGANAPREQTVRMFRPDGYFHLACPFFAADPEGHRSCVLEGRDLQNVAAVLRHIREHHPWRAYCARCHRDFDSPEVRDAHMAERSCEAVGYPAPQGDASRKGVSDDEVRQLRKMDLRHSHEGEAERWRRIYWELFPDLWYGDEEEYDEEGDEEEEGAEAKDQMVDEAALDDNMDGDENSILDEDCDPYLRTGNGYAVSLVHDFWAQHRRECVAAALDACGHDIDELHDDEALKALYQATLKDLISKIYHEYHLDGQAA